MAEEFRRFSTVNVSFLKGEFLHFVHWLYCRFHELKEIQMHAYNIICYLCCRIKMFMFISLDFCLNLLFLKFYKTLFVQRNCLILFTCYSNPKWDKINVVV